MGGIVQATLQPEDHYMVLCSDGIYEFMSNDDIMALVHVRAQLGAHPAAIAQQLVSASGPLHLFVLTALQTMLTEGLGACMARRSLCNDMMMTVTMLLGAGEHRALSVASRGGRQVGNCENHHWDCDVKLLTCEIVGEDSALTLVDNERGRRRQLHRHHHILSSHSTK